MKLVWPVSQMPSPELPTPWWIGVHYAQAYSGGIHTGIDLNLNSYADSGHPIICAADGVIVSIGDGAKIKWPAARWVIVVHHPVLKLWTRYAHLSPNVPTRLRIGATVLAGELLGNIGDYGRAGPKDDHLHFDVATKNLTVAPGDWPGFNDGALTNVLAGYVNPLMLYRACNA